MACRFVRREREIATTKQEMAESENTRHKQQAEHLQRQLSTAQAGLAELTEAAQLHSESTVQHTEMLTKVGVVNGDQRALHAAFFFLMHIALFATTECL